MATGGRSCAGSRAVSLFGDPSELRSPCRHTAAHAIPLAASKREKSEMTKEEKVELALREESTEVALSSEAEAKALFDEASKNAQAILKFKADHYHIRNEPVELGTRYFAHPGNWERQWIRFDDHKVTERIRVKVSSKKPLPGRNTLSDPQLEDTDRDPWTLQNVIPFENVETGELVTFTSSTYGGKMAIEEMVKAYAKAVLGGKARGLPIIELQISSFRSSFDSDVPRPSFPIVDWENPEPIATSAAPERSSRQSRRRKRRRRSSLIMTMPTRRRHPI
jgi:hypothetical protein